MSFVSFGFLIFVSLLLAVYYLVPSRFQWLVLLLFSYAFFWINSGWLLVYLLTTTVIAFYAAKLIYSIGNDSQGDKTAIKKKKKGVLTVSVVLILGILVFLKYYNFLASNINKVGKAFSFSLPGLRLLLPLGISFYTLQAIGYLVDVYRKKTEPDDNIGKFMLFMSFFPQIIQGPIARYRQLANQLYDEHRFDPVRLKYGIQLAMWGYMKKLIIADRIDVPVKAIFDNKNSYTGLLILFVAALYGIQIYCDFSGGMDIARGVSHALGIELELNFRQPYFSTSIEEFWRRWHITLGSWMKDYVFYPLSLSKRFGALGKKAKQLFGPSFGKKLPSFIAMFIVYFLVGIWHGSSWKYIAYGLYNGFFILCGIVFEETYGKIRSGFGIEDDTSSWKIFRIIRTYILVSFGRYFSRGNGTMNALKMIKKTFTDWQDLSFITNGTLIKLGLSTADWVLLLLFVELLFVVDYLHEKDVCIREEISRQPAIFRWMLYTAAILSILIFGIYGPAYDAAKFIYGQF